MAGPPLVSIVTVTWNAPEWAARMFRSVAERTQVPHELIVVDNASGEETRRLVRAEEAAGRARVIQNEENVLWAPACNQGLRVADPASRFVVLMNPDVEILRDDWVARLRAVLDDDPRVAVTGPYLNWKRISPVFGCVDGSVFFMRREAFDQVGLLDAERFPWNGAPYDWCARAFAKGWIYRRAEDDPPILVHHGHKSVAASGEEHPWRRIDVEDICRRAGLAPGRPHRIACWWRRRFGPPFFFEPRRSG